MSRSTTTAAWSSARSARRTRKTPSSASAATPSAATASMSGSPTATASARPARSRHGGHGHAAMRMPCIHHALAYTMRMPCMYAHAMRTPCACHAQAMHTPCTRYARATRHVHTVPTHLHAPRHAMPTSFTHLPFAVRLPGSQRAIPDQLMPRGRRVDAVHMHNTCTAHVHAQRASAITHQHHWGGGVEVGEM